MAKVSLHITILYRHAVVPVDGKVSTENDPQIVKEHLFVISDDDVQDYHAVHKAQEVITGYLKNQLHIRISKLHEFTDAVLHSTSLVTVLEICLAVFPTMDPWCKEIFLKHRMLRGSRMLLELMLNRK